MYQNQSEDSSGLQITTPANIAPNSNSISSNSAAMPSAPSSLVQSIKSKIAIIVAVVTLFSLNSENLQAQSRESLVNWDRDPRSRREQQASPIANIRSIDAPRGLSRSGRACFGTAIQIVTPTEAMARIYKLGENYQEQLYAWVGSATAAKQSSGSGGAISFMNLNNGKVFATIYAPEKYDGHGFGYGLKLSPDGGKFLGIESARGPAAIFNQETGELIPLTHKDFGTYMKRGDGNLHKYENEGGSCLDFLPNGKVLVTGTRTDYEAKNQPIRTYGNFQIFDMKGEHIQALIPPRDEHKFTQTATSCFADMGPRLAYVQKTNTIYYANPEKGDKSRLQNQPYSLGLVGAFDLNNSNFIPIHTYSLARSEDYKISNGDFGHIIKIVDKQLITTFKGYNNKYDPYGAGGIRVYTLEEQTAKQVRDIKIGASLGESIAVTAMAIKDNRFMLVAYRTIFSDDRNRNRSGEIWETSFLGVCDLEEMSFRKIEGLEIKGTGVLGITALIFNPNNPTGIFLSNPAHNKTLGQILELDLKPESFLEYFNKPLYTTAK